MRHEYDRFGEDGHAEWRRSEDRRNAGRRRKEAWSFWGGGAFLTAAATVGDGWFGTAVLLTCAAMNAVGLLYALKEGGA